MRRDRDQENEDEEGRTRKTLNTDFSRPQSGPKATPAVSEKSSPPNTVVPLQRAGLRQRQTVYHHLLFRLRGSRLTDHIPGSTARR